MSVTIISGLVPALPLLLLPESRRALYGARLVEPSGSLLPGAGGLLSRAVLTGSHSLEHLVTSRQDI